MAEGVSREQLESQRRKLRLLGRLQDATSDEVVEVIARENEKDLDYEFFLLLNNLAERMTVQGDEVEAGRLRTLRQKLLQYSDAARQGDVQSEQIISKEDILESLLAAEDEEQQKSLVAAARPLLDYGFFQTLTAMMERAEQAGDAEEAQQLLDLRSKLLDWTDELDAEAKKIWQRKGKLIEEILRSPDWRSALEPKWQEIDPVFLTILSSNVQLAKEQGNEQAATMLQQLADLALVIAREHAPPEVQLLNQLLEADYPDATQRILEQNRDRLDTDFLALIDDVIGSLAAQERGEDIETLRLIRAQVETAIGE
jgi:hypothetical protein